jgi:CRISPR system Cascade subunit CasB
MSERLFSPDSDSGKALLEWWRELQNNSGARVELRRCRDFPQVLLVPEFHRLCNRMRPYMNRPSGWEPQLAAVAGLLAHVKQSGSRGLAEQMAEGDSPKVSQLRFRRFLQRERDDLYPAMIRLIHMLGDTANVLDLASVVFFWGEKTRQRLAFTYFPKVANK